MSVKPASSGSRGLSCMSMASDKEDVQSGTRFSVGFGYLREHRYFDPLPRALFCHMAENPNAPRSAIQEPTCRGFIGVESNCLKRCDAARQSR